MTILGPNGRPIRGGNPTMRRNRDGSVEVRTGTEAHRASPEQLLMEMARAERDGMNHKQLIAHFGLMGQAASPFYLNRALKLGRQLLEQAIAAGQEQRERPIVAMDEVKPDDGADITVEYDEERARWRPS